MLRQNIKKLVIIIVAVLALGVGSIYLVYTQTNQEADYHGVVIDPPSPAENFTLQTDQGEIHLSDFRGKVVLIYFGYTFCPDVCPTTLLKIKQALESLGDEASKVQTIFISVDPERDTPQILGKYSRAFSPNFIGGTSTPENIAEIAKQYGIYYEKMPAESGSGYSVDHTAVIWVIDPSGNLYLEWPYGFEISDMVSDLKKMLE
jgi:protein SCO1/2